MINGTEKYIETVKYLVKLYDYCNEKLFGGELSRPVITVQRDERNKTNGWWSVSFSIRLCPLSIKRHRRIF